jgi:hypothetical protein
MHASNWVQSCNEFIWCAKCAHPPPAGPARPIDGQALDFLPARFIPQIEATFATAVLAQSELPVDNCLSVALKHDPVAFISGKRVWQNQTNQWGWTEQEPLLETAVLSIPCAHQLAVVLVVHLPPAARLVPSVETAMAITTRAGLTSTTTSLAHTLSAMPSAVMTVRVHATFAHSIPVPGWHKHYHKSLRHTWCRISQRPVSST